MKSAKRVGGYRRTVAEYNACEFLALLCQQVPPTGCHMIRYYGRYSVRSRAKRRSESAADKAATVEASPSPGAAARRKRWAQLIRLVFETDPLECPSCNGKLRFVAFITLSQAEVVERVLEHLRIDFVPPPSTGPPNWVRAAEARAYGLAHPEISAEQEFFQAEPPDDYGTIDFDGD